MKNGMKKPRKTQKEMGYVSIGAWGSPDLRAKIEAVAIRNRRSMSAEILIALENHVTK